MTVSPDPDSSDAEVSTALQRFLAQQLPADAGPEIFGLRRSGTGSSRENWPFDAAWSADGVRTTHQPLMRRDPPVSVVDTARSTEFGLLRSLADTAIPAPLVHWLDDEGEHLFRPTMIVSRYEGSAHRAVLRDSDPMRLGRDRQLALAQDLCDLIGDVHGLDIDAIGLRGIFEAPIPTPAEHELTRWEGELDKDELEPHPALRLAAGWLRDHLPPAPARTVLVHGDYRPANVLIEDGRVAVLLDWELAHLGDPLDDLGWYTAPLYAREHFVPGSWEPADFVRRYTARTGTPVDPAGLHFWQVMSTFRLAIMALTGIRAFVVNGADRSAATADRVIKQVLDGLLTDGPT
jgi:aminoglycoside phosphotransferase (APT) family kinase protein